MNYVIMGPCGITLKALAAAGYPSLPYIPERPSAYSIWIGREIISSGLFGYAKAPVAVDADGELPDRIIYRKTREFFTGRKYHTLKYRGPQLLQAHATVIFHLAARAAEKKHSEPVVFQTTAFIKEIGWSDNTASRRRLIGVLDDLTQAHLTTSYVNDAENVLVMESLLARAVSYEPLAGKRGPIARMEVTFSETGLELFRSRPITISLSKRKRLTEGFETWLYGVLRSTFARQQIMYSYLYDLASLPPLSLKKDAARRKEFVRRVKAAVRKMIARTGEDRETGGLFWHANFKSRGFYLFRTTPTKADFNTWCELSFEEEKSRAPD
jgi:hypothetical protein